MNLITTRSIPEAMPAVAAPSLANHELLFESIICDLHWTCLHVGAVASLLSAFSETDAGWTLRSWRRVMLDDTSTMRLALRYCSDMALPPAVEEALRDLYAGFAKLKSVLAPIIDRPERYNSRQRQAIVELAPTARLLAHAAVAALNSVDAESQKRLSSYYAENSKILAAFLRAAGMGRSSCVNGHGEITLPQLAQRRRAPRLTLKHPCRVVFADQAIPAILEDVSRTGLGITCERTLPRGQCVVVEVGNRQIRAAVVWQTGKRIGLQLVASLSTDDPIFSLLAASENAS